MTVLRLPQLKVDVFTSSKEELNEADTSPRKSVGFRCRFSAQLDSKGRVTVPARIRDRLNLGKGDKIVLQLDSGKVVQKEVESYQKALRFVETFESVSGFSFSDDVVEVVLDG